MENNEALTGGVISEDAAMQLFRMYCDTGYNVCITVALISVIVCIYGMVKEKPKLTKDSLVFLGFATLFGILTYVYI